MFGLKRKSSIKKPEKPSNENLSLSDRLKHTRTGLFGEFFSRNKTPINDITLNALENRLLVADTGVKTTDQIIQLLRTEYKEGSTENPLDRLRKILLPILKPVEKALTIPKALNKPHLILVVGVNGVGKTTTIGKLASLLRE